MYKNVEAICYGNNGRSPIKEATFKRTLKLLGIKDIEISSSGVYVQPPENLKEILNPFMGKCIEREVLKEDDWALLESNPEQVLEKLLKYEAGLRNAYLLDNMGVDYSDFKRTQTIARPEAELILPIDEKNLEIVEGIYEGSDYNPEIITLGEFSGLNS